jgi:peptidoglycan/xylan/chitin deacetylase (PgdA/CDA1 family)
VLPVVLALALALLGGQDDWSEITHGDPQTGLVALTFDAGGEAGSASTSVLDILRERGLHVTVFLSGRWVEEHPDLASQIAADGHEIANHSYSHPDLVRLSDDQIAWELDYTDQIIFDAAGVHSRPLFRAPFGSRTQRVLDVAAASGFRSVYWTLDSGDWLARATAAQVAGRVLRFAELGDIVVEHINSRASAEALPTILDAFDERGWHVGTVSQVLGLAPVTAAW